MTSHAPDPELTKADAEKIRRLCRNRYGRRRMSHGEIIGLTIACPVGLGLFPLLAQDQMDPTMRSYFGLAGLAILLCFFLYFSASIRRPHLNLPVDRDDVGRACILNVHRPVEVEDLAELIHSLSPNGRAQLKQLKLCLEKGPNGVINLGHLVDLYESWEEEQRRIQAKAFADAQRSALEA